jgi:hypothetical protein
MFTTLRSKILAGFAAVIAINVVFGLWSIFQFAQVGEPATNALASNYELISNTIQLSYQVDVQLGILQQMANAPYSEQSMRQFELQTSDFRITLAKLTAF